MWGSVFARGHSRTINEHTFQIFIRTPRAGYVYDSRLVTGPARECSFEQTVRNESTISCLGTEVLRNYCKEMEKREILNSCFARALRNRNVEKYK